MEHSIENRADAICCEKVKAEEEASFFKALIEHTRDPIYVLDLEDGCRMFYANQAACQHFGMDLEALQTMRIPDWDPKFKMETVDFINAQIKQGKPARIESEHRTASGAIVPVEITCSNIEYKGKILGVGSFHDISERKRMEEELQRARQELEKRVEERTAELADTMRALQDARDFLDRLINAITDPIYAVDRDLKPVLVNDALCAFFGRSRQDLMKRTKHGLLAKEQNDAHFNRIETVFATEKESISEIEVSAVQGKKHTFLSKYIPYKDLNGNKFIVGISRDITERKQAEEALLLSRFCIDNAGIGIYQTSPEGTIFSVNDFACKSLGYSADELCALSVFDIDPVITMGKMLEIKKTLEASGAVTHETLHRRKDGTTFPVEITANTVIYRGKEYVFSFVKDITERKQAEDALRESEARLKMAMDMARLVKWEYTVKTGMFTFDDQFYALYGTSSEREGGASMPAEVYARRFLPPEESTVVVSGIEAVLTNSNNQLEHWIIGLDGLEHRIIRSDGEERFIVVRAEAVRDQTGSIVKIRGVNQDITERKLMEEELRKSRDELDLRVKERTAELEKANEQLRSVPCRLIAVQEEERKRLASELHDSIAQTLALLKLYVVNALDMRDSGNSQEALKILDQFVPILQRSIEETRAICTGLRPRTLEQMGIIATLKWHCREFSRLYPMHHVELAIDIKEDAIPESLKIVLFRITQEALNNVAKHSQAQWIDVSLLRNRAGIELTIADNGIGMDLDTIFQTKGTNSLGLVGMKERAELVGGAFFIKSEPAKGTTVRARWKDQG
jgi:PAS domain S-box-containing protein